VAHSSHTLYSLYQNGGSSPTLEAGGLCRYKAACLEHDDKKRHMFHVEDQRVYLSLRRVRPLCLCGLIYLEYDDEEGGACVRGGRGPQGNQSGQQILHHEEKRISSLVKRRRLPTIVYLLSHHRRRVIDSISPPETYTTSFPSVVK
jgi:hypothetical protein